MSNDGKTDDRTFEQAIENIRAALDQRSGRLRGTVRSTRRGWRWTIPDASGDGINHEVGLDRDGLFVVVNRYGEARDDWRTQLITALADDGLPVTVLRRPLAPADEGRPVIIENPDTMRTTIEQAFTALAEQSMVYRRGRRLCYPDRSVKVQTRRGESQQLSVQELDVATLKSFLGEAAQFRKRGKGDRLVPVYPSESLCRQMLNHVGDTPTPLAPLVGVRTAPFLRPDGTVCQEPGYDRATALFYDACGTVFPPMPEITPSNALELAKQAVEQLAAPYREFVFDTSQRAADHTWDLALDIGRAILISALPTLLSTATTRTRPGIAVEAPTIASGKTLAIELPIIAALGDDPALIPAEKEVSEDDLAKAMRSALLAARGYVMLDNVQGPANRIPELTTLLTAAKLAIRLFFKQELAEIVNAVLVLLSGNNMELSAELGRRILRARIDTGEARPDRLEHSFDPRAEILANRPQLVIAALTILRAYIVAGRPKQNGVRYGSFEEWARTVRDALMWAGLPDIVQSIDEAFRDDTGTATLGAVIDEILCIPGMGMAMAFTAAKLAELANEREIECIDRNPQTGAWTRPEGQTGPPPLLHVDLHRALATAINPDGRGRVQLSAVTVGRWLKQVDGKWDGEGTEARCIARVQGRKDNIVRYCCEKKDPNSGAIEVSAPELPF